MAHELLYIEMIIDRIEKKRLSRSYRQLDEASPLFGRSVTVTTRQIHALPKFKQILMQYNARQIPRTGDVVWELESTAGVLLDAAKGIRESWETSNKSKIIHHLNRVGSALGTAVRWLDADSELEPNLAASYTRLLSSEYSEEAAHLTLILSECSGYDEFKEMYSGWHTYWFGLMMGDDDWAAEDWTEMLWNTWKRQPSRRYMRQAFDIRVRI